MPAGAKIWLGCTDESFEGVFICEPGLTFMPWTNWGNGEPTSSQQQNCAMATNTEWRSIDCDDTDVVKPETICKVEPLTSTEPDTAAAESSTNMETLLASSTEPDTTEPDTARAETSTNMETLLASSTEPDTTADDTSTKIETIKASSAEPGAAISNASTQMETLTNKPTVGSVSQGRDCPMRHTSWPGALVFRRPFTNHTCLTSSHTIASYHVIAATTCASKCQSNPRCYSFNFYMQEIDGAINCELIDDNGRSATDFILKHNCVYYTT
ncbi:uncharacterized protein [Amphiura filiformis]|uniref:uncharacterized protein n=1 Tax=Amphiura filiformis TaxID=82378 RepID=UPI003B2253DB